MHLEEGKFMSLYHHFPKHFQWGISRCFLKRSWSERFGKHHLSEITMHLVILKVLRSPTIKQSLLYLAIPKCMTIGTWVLGFHLSSISQNTRKHSLGDATLHKDGSPCPHQCSISVNSFLFSFKFHITLQWGDSPTPVNKFAKYQACPEDSTQSTPPDLWVQAPLP